MNVLSSTPHQTRRIWAISPPASNAERGREGPKTGKGGQPKTEHPGRNGPAKQIDLKPNFELDRMGYSSDGDDD